MTIEYSKRIADPIHGTVPLTQVEYELIKTRAFLRLRDVKQLGLAHLVFPGADYSRLSHSIGTCHVAGRMLVSLVQKGHKIADDTHQATRIAALLHDLGHYPFSHAAEDALVDWQKSKLAKGGIEPKPYSHEELGAKIVDSDPQIVKVLGTNSVDRELVMAIMKGESDPEFVSHIVSSELDADRLDYLQRTAANTGLPYGAPDIDYLVGQLTLDSENKLCVTEKALGAADHFLLCRYFDYRQIVFQNTVVAFEEVLKDVLAILLEHGIAPLSRDAVDRSIADGSWNQIDDSKVIGWIRLMREKTRDPEEAQLLGSILDRQPPKLVWAEEEIDDRKPRRVTQAKNRMGQVRDLIPEFARKFSIPEAMWFPWEEARHLTNVASTVPLEEIDDQGQVDEAMVKGIPKSLYILQNGGVRPLQTIERSFMSALSGKALYMRRLYVLFPNGDESKRAAIEIAMSSALN
ncbi:HD domain-containing protein [bacterium AH-315-D21]|nr:HD domain-containing protein [bacterium AH-315-D21]